MSANQFAGKHKAADLWLSHPDRNQFLGGVTCDPTESEPEGYLNLWKGFSVTPAPGDWSLMRAHILKIVCGGTQEYYDYLLNWAARTVQHPEKQGEVAPAKRRGRREAFDGDGWLLGSMGCRSPAGDLVGRFNSHLRDCVPLLPRGALCRR
jgi:hypothetical protein